MGKRGVPARPIDPVQVYELAKIGCNQREMAPVLGVELRTLERRLQSNEELRNAIDRGKAERNISLRRRLMNLADPLNPQVAPNVQVLLHCAKHYLGQVDGLELTGKDGKPIEYKETGGAKAKLASIIARLSARKAEEEGD